MSTESSQRRAAFAAAGLPAPIYTTAPGATYDGTAWDARIGILTHKVIGDVAPQAQWAGPEQYPTLLREAVGRIVKDKTLGRLDRARTRVTGLASQYLREFLPPTRTEFLGTEFAAGRGRVDLAWQDPQVGVWFDELKTWRHSQVGLDEPTWRQVRRYLDAGTATFGDDFVGLRLLTLGNLRACAFISRQGLIEDLTTSTLAPARFTVGGAA